ncbi:hypothetical protein MKW92_005155, partial [Papaver armeniacum]
LFRLTTTRENGETLIEICLDMLVHCRLQRDSSTILKLKEGGPQAEDSLDLLDKSFRPNNESEDVQKKSYLSKVKSVIFKPTVDCKDFPGIPRATQFRSYVIYFERGSADKSILQIKFSANTLEIPWIKISYFSKLIFRNLIAK